MSVIGINFGTSYTSIAYLNKEGRADCLANEEGDRQIASVLAFHGVEEVVGSQAKSDIARNPKTTVANFRAEIGKSQSENLPGSAAPVIEKDGQPAYAISLPESDVVFTAGEVSAKFLRHIRESAEAFLGTPVSGAVLAVPSYFTEQQRKALTEAAEAAGIQVLQLVQESAAAVLAYETVNKNANQDKTVVVCDLGGHSLDVTALTVRSGLYSVLATAHDTKLGGSSLDDLLINHFANEFKKKSKVDIASNRKALAKLRGAVEVTKKMLSSANSAPCFVESLADGLDFHSTINRMRFEIMANKVFAKALDTIREVLTKADLDASEIDEVILVGGSARIPKFAVKIREVFTAEHTKVLSAELEADEVVARGCALQASLLSGYEKEDIVASQEPVITVAPHTQKAIGIVNANGEFVTVIPRGTALPARRTFEFANAAAGQTHAYLALHEGDHTVVKEEIPVEAIEVEEGEEPIEEEPEIVTKVVTKPAALLVEASLPLSQGKEAKGSKIEVQITVDVDSKLSLVVREKNGSNVIKVAGKQ
ncbi:heat shock protein 70 family [Zychaea mexicana]|uniref:heat shock protein 70 family n=1 Tax=Zychaea mexicana TaxID=64656 RepID=UPI0022FEAB29|nr:heat shock protein 70 family [Zychaea mexicana]KAI9493121.1 heat shock protein 70 family [Zychaea mexicana]